MNDELEQIWKEAVMTWRKPKHERSGMEIWEGTPGGQKQIIKNKENSVRSIWVIFLVAAIRPSNLT
jgi:hypothetical protein